MSTLIESPVYVNITVNVDPNDVVSGLNGNDHAVLQFVCQLLALSHSSDLREQLLGRLGIEILESAPDQSVARYDERHWQDEDYLPEEKA